MIRKVNAYVVRILTGLNTTQVLNYMLILSLVRIILSSTMGSTFIYRSYLMLFSILRGVIMFLFSLFTLRTYRLPWTRIRSYH